MYDLEQIVNQDLIEFNQTQDFGQNIVEAQILISIKKCIAPNKTE